MRPLRLRPNHDISAVAGPVVASFLTEDVAQIAPEGEELWVEQLSETFPCCVLTSNPGSYQRAAQRVLQAPIVGFSPIRTRRTFREVQQPPGRPPWDHGDSYSLSMRPPQG
eukprot:GHVU01054254.1.p2 GENE.GHVU01054254.1~~GHVU01054254.1.p2  ORF type:complete len:111 (-),score=11.15 GHVU01054254.1:181-513(-)